jgi:hypothetical protein
MSIKRLRPGRLARIVGWTTATLTWGTTAVAVAAGAVSDGEDPEVAAPPPTAEPPQMIVSRTTTQAPLPAQPSGGLVVIRFTPVERPEAQVITRTVTVAGQAPATASQSPAPAAQQPAPAPVTVQSSGS